MSSSSSWSLRVGCLVGEVLDGLGPEALIGDEALPVLLAEADLYGELLLSGEELPLGGDLALGGVDGLGDGKAGLRNSAHSL